MSEMNKPKIVMGFIYDEEKGYLTLEEYNKQIRAEIIAEISREMRLLYGNEYEQQIKANAIEKCENHLIDSFGRANESEMLSIGNVIKTIVILFKQLKSQDSIK